MDLFWDYLCEADQYLERRVRMIFVGDRSRLQDRLQKRMEELEHDSRDFEKMNLILAINYGGRDEIKHAAQEIAKEVQAGKLAPEAITEQTISEHLQRLYRRDAQCASKTRVIQRYLGEHCSPLRIHNVQMGHTAG